MMPPSVLNARKKLEPGTTVAGRYRIDGVVGKGGYGAVYCATQLDTGIPVALKILLKNVATSHVDQKRFGREAEVVQRLRHPRIVELIDFGTTEKQQPFIAFELLRGESLSEHLKSKGALPLDRVVRICGDVLEGLAVAHQNGVIHRDIKPGNVFLMEDGSGKLLDFGIAKAAAGMNEMATQLTEQGQMIGTPHYMAPEQVRGTGAYPSTDVYALALVMAEMLTGERVIASKALIDVYMAHIGDEPYVFAPAVRSSPLGGIIERAAQKVYEARYPDASAMLADLRRATGQEMESTYGGVTVQRPQPEHSFSGGQTQVVVADEEGTGLGGTMLMQGTSSKQLSSALRDLPLGAATPSSVVETVPQSPVGAPPSSQDMDSTVNMDEEERREMIRAAVDAHVARSSQPPRSDMQAEPSSYGSFGAPSSGTLPAPEAAAPFSAPVSSAPVSSGSASAFSQLPADDPVPMSAGPSEPPGRGWLPMLVGVLVLVALGAGIAIAYAGL